MKKQKIFAIMFSVFLVFILTACNNKADDTATVEQVLNCAWDNEPTSFDITKYNGANDLKIIWNLYEPLVRIYKGQVVAAGAESWTVSDDEMSYTFTLRDNYWSDGQKVDADDYASMLRRLADPDNLFSNASDYYVIKNFESVNKDGAPIDLLGVEVIDGRTLRIDLEYADSNFLTSVELYPERADIVEKYGEQYGYSPENMVCCGPFVLDEWQHNSSLKLKKNDKYWDNTIALDTINILIIPDSATKQMEFRAGNIDYLDVSDENYLKEFRSNNEMYEVNAQSARTYMFLFNCKDAIMQNANVRKALSLAISREEICSVLDNGLTTPAYGLIPPMTMVGEYDFRNEVSEPLVGDVDAKQLLNNGLKELGVDDPSSITITLSCPSDSASQTTAEYYKQMWESSLGINIDINTQEFATYRSLIWSDEYQIATTAWGGSLEPKFLLSRWLPDNQCQWDNDDYANLVETGASTVDSLQRMNLYAEAEKYLIADNAVIAPIKYDGYSVFYYNYVKNAENSPFDNMGFRNITIEK